MEDAENTLKQLPDPTCPFCGHPMKREVLFDFADDGFFMYKCTFCESTTGIYDDPDYAYRAANKRAEAMWINHQFTTECSECHEHVEYVGKGRYCSSCGRKMTKEKSDWNDTIYPYPPEVN